MHALPRQLSSLGIVQDGHSTSSSRCHSLHIFPHSGHPAHLLSIATALLILPYAEETHNLFICQCWLLLMHLHAPPTGLQLSPKAPSNPTEEPDISAGSLFVLQRAQTFSQWPKASSYAHCFLRLCITPSRQSLGGNGLFTWCPPRGISQALPLLTLLMTILASLCMQPKASD